MSPVIMIFSCVLNAVNLNVNFEITEDQKVQSVYMKNVSDGSSTPLFNGNQSVTDSKVFFSGHNFDGHMVQVEVSLEAGMNYGVSTILVGGHYDQTTCQISKFH